MGLDITAFSRLKKVDPISYLANKDFSPNQYFEWEAVIPNYVGLSEEMLNMHEHWAPGRTEGLEAGHYTAECKFSFRAGSYGGYGDWRKWLAELGGYPHKEITIADRDRPFHELIYFSDCEGYLGPVVSLELLRDFALYLPKAIEYRSQNLGAEGEYRIGAYTDWMTAFALAIHGGCVEFH